MKRSCTQSSSAVPGSRTEHYSGIVELTQVQLDQGAGVGGFYGLKLCLLLVSLLFYFATSNAQTSPDPQQIADTMVRLCVGGGHTQATSGGGTGGADLSLRSLDVKGNVKGEFKISKSNAEGLVNGIDNALSQVAADQADKVRLCLQPVRERLLDVLLPAPPVAPEPAVTLQGSPTAPLGETTYYDVMSQNAVRGEWSVGGFANDQLFVVKPLGPSHRIYVEPTDRMQVGQTFVLDLPRTIKTANPRQ